MSTPRIEITMEFRETHVPLFEKLVLKHELAGSRIQVLECRLIGNDIRYSYVVIRGE